MFCCGDHILGPSHLLPSCTTAGTIDGPAINVTTLTGPQLFTLVDNRGDRLTGAPASRDIEGAGPSSGYSWHTYTLHYYRLLRYHWRAYLGKLLCSNLFCSISVFLWFFLSLLPYPLSSCWEFLRIFVCVGGHLHRGVHFMFYVVSSYCASQLIAYCAFCCWAE